MSPRLVVSLSRKNLKVQRVLIRFTWMHLTAKVTAGAESVCSPREGNATRVPRERKGGAGVPQQSVTHARGPAENHRESAREATAPRPPVTEMRAEGRAQPRRHRGGFRRGGSLAGLSLSRTSRSPGAPDSQAGALLPAGEAGTGAAGLLRGLFLHLQC